MNPRILLADEVRLGKTIEACLILHRLILTGRAERILILVPEPLVYQWFVELLRRFNLLFAIYDEARCRSIEAHDGRANPFLDSQLILRRDRFAGWAPGAGGAGPRRGFDLLIVDEAHHLEWSPGEAEPTTGWSRAWPTESRRCCCSPRRPSNSGRPVISPGCGCSIPTAIGSRYLLERESASSASARRLAGGTALTASCRLRAGGTHRS